MRRIGQWGVLIWATLLVFAGCDQAEVTGPSDDPSNFAVLVSGAVVDVYQGPGRFHAGFDPRRPAAPTMFRLYSRGSGAALQIHRKDPAIPGVGIYPLGLGRDLFQARYERLGKLGNLIEAYAADSGELEITHAAEDRIEGKIRFSGFLSCVGSPTGSAAMVACNAPQEPVEDRPTIEVSGSFIATRF